MKLPVMPPVSPMLAELTHTIPEGDLQYEPKWDGFRAIVFRDGDELAIASRNGRPLERYFPELVAALRAELPPRIVLDGEIVIAGERGLDFELLQLRLHPARTRIDKLARETPAHLVAFDVLCINLKSWNAMTPAKQKSFQAAVDKALGWSVQEHLKREAELADGFKKQGLDIYTPDIAAFRAYAQKVYLASDEAKSWAPGILDKIAAVK